MQWQKLRGSIGLHPESVSNRAPRWAKEPVWICVTVVSPNPASFDYFLVEKSLPVFALVCGRYQESAYAPQILSGMVWLQSDLFGVENRWNLQFGTPILHISLMEVVGCVPPYRLGQLIKPYLLLPKTLHAMLYCFEYLAHHPASIIIITQLAELCIFFIIFLVFPTLLIVGTCKIAQTVSDSIEHLFKRCIGLSGCHPSIIRCSHIMQLLHNCCLCILNSFYCDSGFSLHIILDPFLFLFIA